MSSNLWYFAVKQTNKKKEEEEPDVLC